MTAAESPQPVPGLVGICLVTVDPTDLAVRMTVQRETGTIEFALTKDAASHPKVFEAAFNSGDAALVAKVYEEGAAFVPEPGTAVTGDELHAANARFLGLGLPITVHLRHSYVAGDIALLVVDWTIDGTGPDGEPVHIEGTATDVARRGADGFWRYVVDNPFGTA